MIFREDVLFNALEEERGKDKVVVLYGMEIDRIFFFFRTKKVTGYCAKAFKKGRCCAAHSAAAVCAMTVILTPRNRFSTKIIGHETILMIISGALH